MSGWHVWPHVRCKDASRHHSALTRLTRLTRRRAPSSFLTLTIVTFPNFPDKWSRSIFTINNQTTCVPAAGRVSGSERGEV